MKGFIEVLHGADNYLVNLVNVTYIYPQSDSQTTILFNTQREPNRMISITVNNSYEEIKAMISAALE